MKKKKVEPVYNHGTSLNNNVGVGADV
jgi:hypothetical protein